MKDIESLFEEAVFEELGLGVDIFKANLTKVCGYPKAMVFRSALGSSLQYGLSESVALPDRESSVFFIVYFKFFVA